MTYLQRVKTIWSFKSIKGLKGVTRVIFEDFKQVFTSLSFLRGDE